MKKHYILFLFLVFISTNSFAATWQNIATSFNDNYTKIRIGYNNDCVLLGEHGIYYSININATTPTFSQYKIVGNPTDSLKLLNCKFNDLIFSYSGTTYLLCGKDTVNQKAIIFEMNSFNNNYFFRFEGNVNSNLNSIAMFDTKIVGVGNNGLIVSQSFYPNNSPTVTHNIGISTDLYKATTFVRQINNNYLQHLAIGGNGIYLVFSSLNVPPIVQNYPSKKFKILECCEGSGVNVNVTCFNDSINYLKDNGNSIISHSNFDYGPLQATDVFGSNVATKHGMYIYADKGNFLEIDTTSIGYDLNSVTNIVNNYIYACGNNDLLIRTSTLSSGIVIKPFALIKSTGACVPYPIELKSSLSSYTNNCKWFLNGTQIGATSCFPSVNTTPSTAGTDTIMYVVKNYFNLVDTAIKIVTNTDTPKINLPKQIINGSFICKKGNKTIRLYQTQIGVLYELKKPGTNYIFAQGYGTGDSLDFISPIIDSSTTYYFSASPNYGLSCTRNFTDSVVLNVEHTKASFNSKFYNTLIGEQNTFYATSKEAVLNQWWFSNNANPSNIVGNVLNNIIYNSIGQSSTILVATSSHGCKDTLQDNIISPFVVQEPSYIDSCWINPSRGKEPLGNGSASSLIDNVTLANNNILYIGNTKYETYTSQYGRSYTSDTTIYKASLLMYSPNGTLKSYLHIKQNVNNQNSLVNVTNIETDDSSNIFLTASAYASTIYFPNGDSIYYSDYSLYYKSILIKLDSNLNFKWQVFVDGFSVDLKKDYAGNLLWLTTSISTDSSHYTNTSGITTKIDWINPYPFSSWTGAQVLFKIDKFGQKLWFVPIIKMSVNGSRFSSLKIDANDNIILGGSYEDRLSLFNSNNMLIPIDTNIGQNGIRTPIVVKYNSNGIYQWKNRLFSMNEYFGLDGVYDIEIDNANNIYFNIDNLWDNSYIKSVNPNQSVYISNDKFSSCIVKLNPQGNTQWMAGTKQVYQYNELMAAKLQIVNNKIIGVYNHINFHINNMTNPEPFYFYSQNILDSVAVSNQYNGFCVVSYNLDGHVNCTLNYGTDSTYLGYSGLTDITIVNQNQISFGFTYINMTFQFSPPYFPYQFYPFNDSLIHDDGASLIAKINLNNCGLKYCNTMSSSVPTVYNHVFQDACLGNVFIFPNNISWVATYDTAQYSHFNTINGIDSIVVTHLSVHAPLYQFYTYNICAGQSITLLNGQLLNNLISDTLLQVAIPLSTGCDSIYQYQIFVSNSGFTNVVDSICMHGNYTLPNGTIITNITSPKYQVLLYPTGGFCDSVVTYTINIKPISNDTNSLTVCKNSNLLLNNISISNIQSDTVLTQHFTTSNNCDSIMITLVDVIQLNANIVGLWNMLSTNAINVNYQWLNCTTGQIISNANQNNYTPTANGIYAVIIDSNGCKDTSICLNYSVTSINQLAENNLKIYPNPSFDFIIIETDKFNNYNQNEYKIFTALGELVLSGQLKSKKQSINIQSLSTGLYFIKIYNQIFKFDKKE